MNNVTLNKDISKIHETMFWGLPMRKTLLSAATIIIGIYSHAILYEYILNDDLLLILTGLCCSPTGFIAFFSYQGMTGEKVILEVIRSIMLKKELVLTNDNFYDSEVREIMKLKEREVLKNDKIFKKQAKRKKASLPSTEKGTGHNSV